MVRSVHRSRRPDLRENTCEVREGDRYDAKLYAVGANATHGLRRTNAQKRHAVEMAIARWADVGNREIARRCGVDEGLVRKVKEALSADSPQIAAPETRTVTRGGTTYQQKVARKKPAPRAEPASDPVVSLPLPSPAPMPTPADEPLPEQEPGSNVIPLGDRLPAPPV